MKAIAHLRSFTRPAQLFILAMFVFALGISGPSTLMNLYLDATGLDRVYIGWWQASSQFGGLACILPAMWLFGRMGRRRALWLGAGMSIAVRSLTVLSINPSVIVLAEAASGFGTVLYGLASVSFLADASTEADRAEVFSLNDFLRTAALLIGSALAGWLPGVIAPALADPTNLAASYRAVLIGSFAIRMLGVIPLWMIGHSAPGVVRPLRALETNENVLHLINPRYLLRQPPQTYLLAAPYMLVWLADSLIFPFFSLFLRDKFGLTAEAYGLISSLRGLVGALALLTPPILMSRYRPARLLAFSFFALAIMLGLMGLSQSAGLAILFSFVYVAIFAAAMMVYRVFVINQTDRARYLLVSSVLGITMNAGPAFAPPISGYLQRQFGFGPVIALAVGLMALALAAWVIVLRIMRRR
ncbi:MAG TPA: MFS transporter [Thermoflexales bacterium]|nr:MFS transporter [Thermoflexales bacterium]HQW35182.1 MFS transporter [Thermoflexales bacterium]HQZ23197.1 MFS transporter [Thermoflexales bacterium]HQZ98895.1 MFS transporter [Thermoflexales bacterium]